MISLDDGIVEKAILVKVDIESNATKTDSNDIIGLMEAASISPICTFTQHLVRPHAGNCIGSGKIDEIKAYIEISGADLVVFDIQLTPAQQKNLSDAFKAEVLDRTALILQIFAKRARTREAVSQVEYAALAYMLPRLAGLHRELGRQGGAGGSMSAKGEGEKKLELDRRRIESKMAELRRELGEIESERKIQRNKRIKSGIPMVSLVGYTNAGKSTIMNSILRYAECSDSKSVYEHDQLFATLDTSVRKIYPGDGAMPFFLTDTVGFIERLPSMLIKSFRSTLEEAKLANLLLIVTDISDENARIRLQTTVDTLSEIGAESLPRLYVWNKADLIDELPSFGLGITNLRDIDDIITISAKNPADIDRLIKKTNEMLLSHTAPLKLLIPYASGDVLSYLMDSYDTKILDYTGDGTIIIAHLPCDIADKYKKFTYSVS